MKYLDFEKHIKKELEDSKETVQMDALLASLNLGKAPSKPTGFALWMIIPLLILALSVFAWMYMDSSSNDEMNSFLVEEASIQNSNDKAAYAAGAITNSVKDNSVIDKSDLIETKVELKNTEKTQISSTYNSNTSKENTKSTGKSTKNNNRPPAHNARSTKESINSNSSPSYEADNDGFLNTSYNSSKATVVKSDSKSYSARILKAKASRDLVEIENLYESIDWLEDNEVDEELFSRMKINCPSFDNAGWHMALIPEIGIFMPQKTLANKSLEESIAYTKRVSSESTLEGLEIGLYGMLVRDNVPFYIKAGISYSRITERMDLKYEFVVPDTTLGIISTTVSDNGDTITNIYGDIITETTYKGSNRQHHYIHLFDLPISIGYSTYIAGLDIGIEGGVKVNFMTRATGKLLISEKDYLNLSLNRQFKNRIGLSYFGGLMIGRNFGRFGDFYLAPRFTYYPNEFNSQNNTVSQKYFSVGLNAGVVYKIN